MSPVDAVTLRQAAEILGLSVSSVRRLIAAGRLPVGRRYQHRSLPRADVEALAGEIYPWWRHVNDPESYWVTGRRAARVLGVTRARLGQLARGDLVPYVAHQDGTRLYRRHQLAVMAKAREPRPP
jgi:excisionase family DNA binding protein